MATDTCSCGKPYCRRCEVRGFGIVCHHYEYPDDLACPKCGSYHVVRASRQEIGGTGGRVIGIRRTYVCDDCHDQWEIETGREDE